MRSSSKCNPSLRNNFGLPHSIKNQNLLIHHSRVCGGYLFLMLSVFDHPRNHLYCKYLSDFHFPYGQRCITIFRLRIATVRFAPSTPSHPFSSQLVTHPPQPHRSASLPIKQTPRPHCPVTGLILISDHFVHSFANPLFLRCVSPEIVTVDPHPLFVLCLDF